MDKMENKMDTQSPKAKAAGEYDYKMILAGAGCVAAMSTFGAYRAKWTNVFKASYASTWLTLGPATLMYVTPDEATQRKRIAEASSRRTGVQTDRQVESGQIGQSVEERRRQIESMRMSVEGAGRVLEQPTPDREREPKKGGWFRGK